MQKSVIFVKKNSKINIWKRKNIAKEWDHDHKREYRGAVEHWEYRTLKNA